jgi:tetratricopeptide (TPR) repeat protein
VPGALALRFVSSDARTFKEPPPDWQIGSWNDPRSYFAGSPEWLAGDLIREGASGVAGQVAEPYLDGVIRPDVLFPAYLSGFNLVESFFLALPYLSWRSVVIGDPLCAPFRSGHEVPAEDLDPALDPETELPAFFSERRLRASAAGGTPGRELKLLAKVEARLARDEAQGARHALEAAVRLDSQMPGAQAMLASLYDQAGEYDRAVAWYEASLTTRPQNAAALNNLAYTLAVNKGELERALELAGKAYILSNGDPLMTDTLAWIQHLSGNHEEAARLLQQAVRGAPDHAEVRFHAAVVDAARGELAGARAELARALQLDPAMALREDARALQRRLEGREE